MKPSKRYLKHHWSGEYEEFLPRLPDLRKTLLDVSRQLDLPSVERYIRPIEAVKPLRDCFVDFSGPTVRFGRGELEDEQRRILSSALESLVPWRKGPFQYFDEFIDTEWLSYRKWDRVFPFLIDPKDKIIGDVGCNNGYYMYRLLGQGNPKLLLGLDPVVRYYFYFELNRKFHNDSRVQFDLLGVEHLDLFPDFFDMVLFMGVIYHRRNPLETLQKIAVSMKSGGTLILESAGIPGDSPLCLLPRERYLKAPGYWFIPTASALENMLCRTGFRDVEVFDRHLLETGEQRRTKWAPYESLENFLDPEDNTKTVEGYPAPDRIYIRAIRR